jgi:hypothetical protein
VFRLETRARPRVANLAETRASGMAPKLSTPMGMNTRGMLERFTPFKRDSVRRIDWVIDYFGETRSMRGPRGGRSRRALFSIRGPQLRRAPQLRSRTESGVSAIVSLSARSR